MLANNGTDPQSKQNNLGPSLGPISLLAFVETIYRTECGGSHHGYKSLSHPEGYVQSTGGTAQVICGFTSLSFLHRLSPLWHFQIFGGDLGICLHFSRDYPTLYSFSEHSHSIV